MRNLKYGTFVVYRHQKLKKQKTKTKQKEQLI